MENEIFQPKLFEDELPKEKSEEAGLEMPQERPIEEPVEKPDERSDYDLLVESVAHTVISKDNLEAALKKYYDNKQVKEVGTLHVTSMTNQPSGYEFFMWVKASEEVAKISGTDIVLENLSEHQQEICQRIIAPEKFLESSTETSPVSNFRPSMIHEEKTKDYSGEDEDGQGPWVPGKGYVN